MANKRAQVTIFIIIAIVLVASVILIFIFKDSLVSKKIPAEVEPIYSTFLSCVQDQTLIGINLLESQAGYIFLPEFESASRYMPFSSQLDFLGNAIPYWYYVSGNNIAKEQVPTLQKMQDELSDFIEDKINTCNFDDYYNQGFEITQGIPKANVQIKNSQVEVNLEMDFSVSKENTNSLISSHKIIVNSNLGNLYNSAIKVYSYENENLFLEKYAIDNLRLYAPVDGVELTCSPLIWNAEEVFSNLQDAIEANTLSLKTKGNEFSLKNENEKYFVVDEDFGADVRFLNFKSWTNAFEVNPSDGPILISTPVGNQPGLGILGFCYVPYHFVYDVKYPVLVQLSLGEETFQFPLAVVLKQNNPREALDSSAVSAGTSDLCEYKNTPFEVNLYDNEFNPVDAEISYECFDAQCDLGKTSQGNLIANFPQCVNGFIVAHGEGFVEERTLVSTVESSSVNLVLDKLYEKEINLKLDSKDYSGEAIISFISDKNSKTIIYPEQKIVELSEGQYEIEVDIYKSSDLKIEATKKEQCTEVAKSGFGALLGLTETKCFEINFPSQIVSNALAGGGKQKYYILESELKDSSIIEINSGSLPEPKTLEQLQDNYILFEGKGLEVNIK